MNLPDIASSPNKKLYKKETGISLTFADESHFTCLLWARILGNVGFYAGPTYDALKEANSSRERSLRGESWSGSPFSNLDFVKMVFLEENFGTEWWMLLKTDHQTLDGSSFVKQNTQVGTTFLNVTLRRPTSSPNLGFRI